VEPLLDEVAERQQEVLRSGRYILGPEVEAFEREFAAHLGRRHCIGVANGTEAITIALRALGITQGDDVIVPAFGFFASAEAVVNAGAVPVFADIDEATGCVTSETVEAAITHRTRAILPVHMFGNVAPMTSLCDLAESRELAVIADAAQAAGANLEGRAAGAWGTAAAFSFYPGKNLGAFGDAGAIVTDDEGVAAVARRLRAHGETEKWVHTDVAYNSRLDELQATALRVLLPHLDGWSEARRAVAGLYCEAGLEQHVQLPRTTPGATHGFHLYVVAHARRDELIEALAGAGIEARAYYTTPLPRQPALAEFDRGTAIPNAERLATQGLALPMGPSLEPDAVGAVVEAVAAALSA
jgi:dTDP-3-amino-3,4,6-trideoxy-alpha-D-glucose transaminase